MGVRVGSRPSLGENSSDHLLVFPPTQIPVAFRALPGDVPVKEKSW
jgi:hypothetical protein